MTTPAVTPAHLLGGLFRVLLLGRSVLRRGRRRRGRRLCAALRRGLLLLLLLVRGLLRGLHPAAGRGAELHAACRAAGERGRWPGFGCRRRQGAVGGAWHSGAEGRPLCSPPRPWAWHGAAGACTPSRARVVTKRHAPGRPPAPSTRRRAPHLARGPTSQAPTHNRLEVFVLGAALQPRAHCRERRTHVRAKNALEQRQQRARDRHVCEGEAVGAAEQRGRRRAGRGLVAGEGLLEGLQVGQDGGLGLLARLGGGGA
jgi:hypothetical protein